MVDVKVVGEGKVICMVFMLDGVEFDVDVVENYDGIFDIYYIVFELGKYVIIICFGGEYILNSFFYVLVCDFLLYEEEFFEVLQLCQFYVFFWFGVCFIYWVIEELVVFVELMEFMLRFFNLVIFFVVQKGEFIGEVWMFLGKMVWFNIIDNKDGIIIVRYVFIEKGLYQMGIKYDGNYIFGSFLQFYVDVINSCYVSVYGLGLSYGMVNKLVIFIIVIKDVGEGGLLLVVEGLFKVEIICKDNKDGICIVFYLLIVFGDYSIIVCFDDKYILGSFFIVKIIGDDFMRILQLNVGIFMDVLLKIIESDLSQLIVSICVFLGNEEFCLLKCLFNWYIGIFFIFKEVGEYVVSVCKSGKYVINSFFKILVGLFEIGDVSKVWVWGKGFFEGYMFQVVEFIVDICNVGYGGLGLSIEGLSKVDINCEDMEDGICKVIYCFIEFGIYIINIKFVDKYVFGSFFIVKVIGEGCMKESIIW